MDIGVWMSPGVLAHKLEARAERNTLANWNTKSVPRGLGESCEEDRLFVASRGVWRGYFVLSKEALYTPEDAVAPITLLFDATTWTPIDPVPVSRFRGIRVLKRGPTQRPKDTSWNDKEISSRERLK
jgi:hypothetical protein